MRARLALVGVAIVALALLPIPLTEFRTVQLATVGAVVGGLVLGVLLNLVGTYVHWVGGELRLATALVVILAVLLFRPAGLFGRAAVRRV